jgi:hypothetical protein
MNIVSYKKGEIIYNDLSFVPEYNIKYIQMKKHYAEKNTTLYPKINKNDYKRYDFRNK